MKRMLLAAAACAALAACGTIKLDRAISGGAMGLGAGALAGPGGAVAGGLIGAGVGAVTPPSLINLGQPFWRRWSAMVLRRSFPWFQSMDRRRARKVRASC